MLPFCFFFFPYGALLSFIFFFLFSFYINLLPACITVSRFRFRFPRSHCTPFSTSLLFRFSFSFVFFFVLFYFFFYFLFVDFKKSKLSPNIICSNSPRLIIIGCENNFNLCGRIINIKTVIVRLRFKR